jgi:hypothetical protein
MTGILLHLWASRQPTSRTIARCRRLVGTACNLGMVHVVHATS